MARKKSEPGGAVNGTAVADPPTTAIPSEPNPDPADMNRPAHIVRYGPVRACVWANETDQGLRFNVTVNRLYKGQDDQWHTTDGFGYNHLLPLAKALDHAHSWIAEQFACNDVPF